jgi:hypothetical protein
METHETNLASGLGEPGARNPLQETAERPVTTTYFFDQHGLMLSETAIPAREVTLYCYEPSDCLSLGDSTGSLEQSHVK